jgi:cholesterol oxidase
VRSGVTPTAGRFDAIVIGSGFGGAVTACRLAEKGLRVLVLERGRAWSPADYPSATGKDWIWNRHQPERENGWIDLRVFDDVAVVQGAGVGGGSLIGASVSVEAAPQVFDRGWPPEITFAELQPYYAKAGAMLGVQELPDGQLTARFKLMRDGANAIGAGDRFRKLPLAVTFDPDWSYDRPHPFAVAASRRWTNPHGKQQGTCIHCGDCTIGCRVQAKNTLDLNYLAAAERQGVQIRPLHLASRIAPEAGGYRVHFIRLADGRRSSGDAWGRRIILAAGSVGSTELLLRCRDQAKTLPDLSPRLGEGWSTNGDFLTPAVYPERDVSSSRGPTVTCAIDSPDSGADAQRIHVADGGCPGAIGQALEQLAPSGVMRKIVRAFRDTIGKATNGRDPLDCVMPWSGQATDMATGRLSLEPTWWTPTQYRLELQWDSNAAAAAVQAVTDMHRTLSAATGGTALGSPSWSVLNYLITPHPLGGCRMGRSAADGVVDHQGRVFGYPGLYVADGAIVPRALGLGPARTIAALAERSAALMPL